MKRFVRILAALIVASLLATSCANRGGATGPQDVAAPPVESRSNAESIPTEASVLEEAAPSETEIASLGLEPGDYTFALEHGRRTRTYIVHVPPSPTVPAPILVALHGGGGTGQAFQEQNGLDAVADREGFVAVYPEGTGLLPNRLHTWNSGNNCCGFALDRQIDDVDFLRNVLADLATHIEVDPGRTYMTGHSNGAMMAYRFANEAPEMVTAIAPVGGAHDLDLATFAQPVAVLHIHSLDDPRAIYEGGEGPPFPGTNRTVHHEPVRASIEEWAALSGCDPSPETGPQIAGTSPNDGQSRQLIVWSDCQGAVRVEHLLLTGSGHGWQGVEEGPILQRLLGPPTTIINASEEVWAFVSQFDRE